MIARFDRFTFDSGRRVLLDGGRDITPAPRVFDVLEVLIQHAPNAVEKDTLALRVWKDATPQDGSLSTAIGELRKALGDAGGSPRIIRTVHGFGYRLAVEVARDADQRQPAAAPRCWLAIGDRTIPLASGRQARPQSGGTRLRRSGSTTSRCRGITPASSSTRRRRWKISGARTARSWEARG
jgi:DNA-binding winged helix-turn-helix (wHTH) protein